MNTFGRCVAGMVLATGLSVAGQTGAMTVASPGATVNKPAASVTATNSVITSIDLKQGRLVAGGRTYRFDSASVAFSDQRRVPPPGGLASLKAGQKVTLHTTVQDGAELLLQIDARD